VDWAKPAIRVAAAGLGAAVGGPLGGGLGVWLGPALGTAAVELIGERAQKFGDEAGKKLFDVGSDSLAERLKRKSVDLDGVYRKALRKPDRHPVPGRNGVRRLVRELERLSGNAWATETSCT
jgi:hypothetical protein